MIKYKAIKVDWVDSQIVSLTWQHATDINPTIAKISTLGFLIAENNDIVTIALSVSYKEDAETQIGQVINIPKCCIIKRKFITSS